MPIPTHTVVCLSNRVVARDVWEFRLTKPEGFNFVAGQFVLFKVGLIENPNDIQTRAFSIASAPHEKDLLFVAKMKQGGRASRWIAEVLKEGSTVEFQGPFGRFTLKHDKSNDYLFVATGTGLAPFRGQIIDALSKKDTRMMDLIFGVRSEEDLFWLEELQSLEKAHDNLSVHIALSQPTASWTGHKGRVQTVTPEAIKDLSARQMYLCGSPEMTTDMKKTAIEQWAMPKENVHAEGYI